MIPKVIHYCWFGGNPKPDTVIKCINSWKRFCPDYEIKEWNEDNFDINIIAYVREAFEHKKWAFVSDYVRLYALYNYGGIYMDTDVEVVKNIDQFLEHECFGGYETDNIISSALIGCSKKNEWIGYLLSFYNNKHFVKKDGILDLTTNTLTISRMTEERYKIALDGEFTNIDNKIIIYPKQYFCPKLPGRSKIKITSNTYAIHHFDCSWVTGNKKIIEFKLRNADKLYKIKKLIIKILGEESFNKIRGRK